MRKDIATKIQTKNIKIKKFFHFVEFLVCWIYLNGFYQIYSYDVARNINLKSKDEAQREREREEKKGEEMEKENSFWAIL